MQSQYSLLLDNLSSEEQLDLVLYLINTKFNHEQKNQLRSTLNPFNLLSESDVIYEVFSFIDFRELIELRVCNRKFNEFITSDHYWTTLFNQYFGQNPDHHGGLVQHQQHGSIFTRFIEELKRSLRFKLESLVGGYVWNTSWSFDQQSLSTTNSNSSGSGNDSGSIRGDSPLPLKVVTFQAKANNDIHIGLSTAPFVTSPMYEIVIGGWNNHQSVIRKQSQGPNLTAISHHPCNPVNFCDYWVCLNPNTGAVSCGAGKIIGENQYMIYRDSDVLDVKCVGFSTWDKSIEYRNVKINSIMPLSTVVEHEFFMQLNKPVWLTQPHHISTTPESNEVFVFKMKKSLRNLSVQFSSDSFGANSVEFSLPFSPSTKLKKRTLQRNGSNNWIKYYVLYNGKRAEIYVSKDDDDDESIPPVLYETKMIPNNGYTSLGFNGEQVKFSRISEQEFKQKINGVVVDQDDSKVKQD